MFINDLPAEILHGILKEAAVLNEHRGVKFTYGLSRTQPD